MFPIKLLIIIFVTLLLACNKPDGHAQNSHNGKKANHLAKQSSPYLLQHAYNPVDWYPWGDEALEKAKAENIMIIVSVGYSACHWCHVMEHESFEDSTVAKIMNENFVCIKVDREERPDVDDVYMTACHLASGRSCGWPLNAFALPDGRPFWAGTYFPKKKWTEVLNHFIKMRKEDPDKVEEYALGLTGDIQKRNRINAFNDADKNFTREKLDQTAANFINNIDFKKGGRQGAPKFPMPNNYLFLLRYAQLYEHPKSMEAVNKTLESMANGGIYDHLGGGFARYSTDDDWLVPHFEKMMYDNGQLVSLYSQAFQVTKNPLYKKVVLETLEYVKREMTSPEGGFFSSLDADSEGEEGKFYVWTSEEIEGVIKDEKNLAVYNDYFEIRKNGNWEHHKNILHRKKSAKAVAKTHQITIEKLNQIIKENNTVLFKARAKRIRPGLDDKILTSWNALMLKGYIDAYRAFGEKEYLDIAIRNANFLDKNALQQDFRLNRNYKDGISVINAFLDDYALLIEAFIDLYQVTFDEKWLKKAKGMADYSIQHFLVKEAMMFNYTSDIDPPLIARKMVLTDNVIPGSNSSMARVLHQLGSFFYEENFLEIAQQMMQNIEGNVTMSPQPNFYSNWCRYYSELVTPSYEVAIVGENYEQINLTMQSHYLPNALFLGGADEGSLELLESKLSKGETRIYVCQNKVCKLPVTTVEEALKLMK